MTSQKERGFASLESLRFIASAVIVLFHYTYYLQKRELFRGYLAVDLFFVLSGFVIAFAYHSRIGTAPLYGHFLRKRFARLYPLHALTLLLYASLAVAIVLGLVKVIDPDKYRFPDLIYNALLIHAWGFSHGYSFNTVSWSISAELGAYLLFPLVISLIERGWWTGLSVVGATYVLAIAFAWKMYGVTFLELTWNFGVIRALPSFVLGVWLFTNLSRLARSMSGLFAITSFYVCLVGWIASMVLNVSDYIALLFSSALVCFAAIADSKGEAHRISHRWISNHGELTYSIYMIHPLVATVVISGLGIKLFGTSTPAVAASILLAVCITYGLSLLSYRYLEEPARQWLGGSRPRHISDRPRPTV